MGSVGQTLALGNQCQRTQMDIFAHVGVVENRGAAANRGSCSNVHLSDFHDAILK